MGNSLLVELILHGGARSGSSIAPDHEHMVNIIIGLEPATISLLFWPSSAAVAESVHVFSTIH